MQEKLMKKTIKKSIGILFLVILSVLPFVFSGCGTKSAAFTVTNSV
jgi:hypothetical protein